MQQHGALFVCKGGNEMRNLQPNINKMLKALRGKGRVYKINTQQFYSEEQDRLITKMILWEEHPNRDGEVFYSKVELLKYLVEQWKKVNDHGAERSEGTDEGTCQADE